MGCGCGGRKYPTPRAPGVQSDDSDTRPHRWVVDFPNGAQQKFDHQWQANAARAVGGGYEPRKEYIDG